MMIGMKYEKRGDKMKKQYVYILGANGDPDYKRVFKTRRGVAKAIQKDYEWEGQYPDLKDIIANIKEREKNNYIYIYDDVAVTGKEWGTVVWKSLLEE